MTTEAVVSRWAAGQAPAAHLLAHWWSRPTPDQIDAWAECWPGAFEIAAQLGLERDPLESLRTTLADSSPDALADEYERLLNGPGRAPCPPYESLWRDDSPRRERGKLMGAPAADLVQLYRGLSLQVRADAHELPDHIAIEWEALAFACEHDAHEAAARLVDEHLAHWIPAFCAAVGEETTQPFYAALAGLTAAWTAALAE